MGRRGAVRRPFSHAFWSLRRGLSRVLVALGPPSPPWPRGLVRVPAGSDPALLVVPFRPSSTAAAWKVAAPDPLAARRGNLSPVSGGRIAVAPIRGGDVGQLVPQGRDGPSSGGRLPDPAAVSQLRRQGSQIRRTATGARAGAARAPWPRSAASCRSARKPRRSRPTCRRSRARAGGRPLASSPPGSDSTPMLMRPPALTTKSGAHRMPRAESTRAMLSSASWLLAAPAIT